MIRVNRFAQRAAILAGLMALAILAGAFARSAGRPLLETREKVMKIAAHRFRYEPETLTLKKGEPVILEFTSIDVVHGFNLPDFNTRIDVLPGETRRVRLVPDKAGTFSFHCDNFCGVGHEEMAGVLTVVE